MENGIGDKIYRIINIIAKIPVNKLRNEGSVRNKVKLTVPQNSSLSLNLSTEIQGNTMTGVTIYSILKVSLVILEERMSTYHKLIIGNCTSMKEISDGNINLIVTSPPYFNAPFDYEGLYNSYEQYLNVLKNVAEESFRVLQNGRIFVLNIDDMLIDGEKFPIVADATRIFLEAGFRYRDRIIWKKPDGYLRISRRSGVILQNPYPMYFYPDNLLESIIIFQKGRFDYKSIPRETREASKIDLKEFQDNKWYMTLWEMVNVLPGSTIEKCIAAFPDELAYRCIKLFSYVGETVLDPFCGSGTTLKVARELGRNSIGIEINDSLLSIIKTKMGFDGQTLIFNQEDKFEYILREEK